MQSIILLKISDQQNEINFGENKNENPSQVLSTSHNSQLRICPYINDYNLVSHYFCYKNEICCKQGCCTTYTYKYFHSWYFWLIVILLFLALYGASWYCKKIDRARKRRRRDGESHTVTRRRCSRQTDSVPASQRNTDSNNPLGDNNLNQRISGQFCTVDAFVHAPTNRVEPPPRYSDALKMPKKKRNSNTLGQTSQDISQEELPTYESVTKKSEEK